MSTAGGASIPPEQLKARYIGTGVCVCVSVFVWWWLYFCEFYVD